MCSQEHLIPKSNNVRKKINEGYINEKGWGHKRWKKINGGEGDVY